MMFLLVRKLLSCPCGAPSLTRGRVRHLSVIVGSIIPLSFVQLFTSLLLKPNRMHNIYKAPSVIKNACLLARYLVMDVLLLRA
jgi:hypothetical protein